MQKIHINYLGPVKKLDMEIRDFNLLIGEQAVGKSTVAKAIYFFKIIKTTLADYLCQLYDTASYNGKEAGSKFYKIIKPELNRVFLSLFGYSWDLDERLYIKYEYTDDVYIDVKLNQKDNKKYISIQYSERLTHEIEKLQEAALELHSQKKSDTNAISLAYASKERLRNYDHFNNSINKIFNDAKEIYYIPAGRSMITLLVNSRSLLENENLDLITRQFMQIIDNLKGAFSDGIRNVHKRYPDGERKFDVGKTAEMLISNLKGDYKFDSGREYIVAGGEDSSGEKIPINYVSSGQQEVLWLLNQLYVLMLKREASFIIIEEPEAHLYPELQNQVMEFISLFANATKSSVLITTHSPYILTSFNTLYCAGNILKEFPNLEKKVRNILKSRCEIMPDQVTALKLSVNQEAKSLIDEELQELSTEMIDEISDIINEKYTDLFYLHMDN